MSQTTLKKTKTEAKSRIAKTCFKSLKESLNLRNKSERKAKNTRKIKVSKNSKKESRKRTKDQLSILESFYEKDPEWTRKTFCEAAAALKIKPIQAYKWGYHKKIKENESNSEAKPTESKETSQENCAKNSKDPNNYNEIVEDIVNCLSDINDEKYNSVDADKNYDIENTTPSWIHSSGCLLSKEAEGRTQISCYTFVPQAFSQKSSKFDFDYYELTNVLSDINNYDEIKSINEICSQMNDMNKPFEEDFSDNYSFQEFNCISLQEEERVYFKSEEKDRPVIHFDNYM